MKIEFRNGKVHISGYVNAVGRDSRPIYSPNGEFVEMIEPGVFADALKRAENVDILLNHDEARKLGSTKQGNLTLTEDNIGLHAETDISDPEVIQSAKSGKLRGWSFGFYKNEDEMEQRINNIPRRHVKSLDIFEVSLIDTRMTPAYAGTSVECRADKNLVLETRSNDDPAEPHESGNEQLEYWQKRVNKLKLSPYQDRIDELRRKTVDFYGNGGIIEDRAWFTDKNGNKVYIDDGGGGGSQKSPRLDMNGEPFDNETLWLPSKEYGEVVAMIGNLYRKYEGQPYCEVNVNNVIYLFENRGYSDYNIYAKYDDPED